MLRHFKEISLEIFQISLPLFKILIPFIIILRFVEKSGFIEYFSKFVEPLMAYLNLPGELGFVWITAMLINFYAGIVVFINLYSQIELNVAQVTILCVLMLQAHNLPIECTISKRAGVGYLWTVGLRIFSAIFIAYTLNLIYSNFNLLQENFDITLLPTYVPVEIYSWIFYQLKILTYIFLILSILIIIRRFLKKFGIEKIIRNILSPFLNFFGINKKASEIIIVGIIIGLTFGAALIIKESDSGKIDKKSVILSVLFLNLIHAIIEDTGLMLMIGGHMSGIFFFRIFFSLLIIFLVSKLFFTDENKT